MATTRVSAEVRAAAGSDAEIINAMAQLVRRFRPDREVAKQQVFMWVTILALLDNTNMSGVLDRFLRSAPSRHDQEQVIGKLRGQLLDLGVFELTASRQ